MPPIAYTPQMIFIISRAECNDSVHSLASNLFSIGLLTGVVSLSGSIDRETVSRYIISLSVS